MKAKVSIMVYSDEGEIVDSELVKFDCLHDAVKELFNTRSLLVDGIECIESSDSEIVGGRGWLEVCHNAEFDTGERENKSLHVVCTAASKKRLFKLLGASI